VLIFWNIFFLILKHFNKSLIWKLYNFSNSSKGVYPYFLRVWIITRFVEVGKKKDKFSILVLHSGRSNRIYAINLSLFSVKNNGKSFRNIYQEIEILWLDGEYLKIAQKSTICTKSFDSSITIKQKVYESVEEDSWEGN